MSVVVDKVNALKTQLNTLATAQIQSLPAEAPTEASLNLCPGTPCLAFNIIRSNNIHHHH